MAIKLIDFLSYDRPSAEEAQSIAPLTPFLDPSLISGSFNVREHCHEYRSVSDMLDTDYQLRVSQQLPRSTPAITSLDPSILPFVLGNPLLSVVFDKYVIFVSILGLNLWHPRRCIAELKALREISQNSHSHPKVIAEVV